MSLPFADRSHIAISGCEFVRFSNFTVQGNRTAIALDTSFGVAQLNDTVVVVDGAVTRSSERIANGRADFFLPRPVSLYPGFQSSTKIKLDGNTLSNTEIDTLWP